MLKFFIVVVVHSFLRNASHAVRSRSTFPTPGSLEDPHDPKILGGKSAFPPLSKELEHVTNPNETFTQPGHHGFNLFGDIKARRFAEARESGQTPEGLNDIADLLGVSIFDLLHISRGTKAVGWSVYGMVCAYSIGVALVGTFFVLTKGVKRAGNPDPSKVERWRRTMLILLARALVLTSGTLSSTIVGGQIFLTDTFHLSVAGYNNLSSIRMGAALAVVVCAPSIARRTGKLPLILGSCCIMFAAAFLQGAAMHLRSTWVLLLSGVCQVSAFGYVSYMAQAITMELAPASEQSKQEAFWWFLLILDTIAPVIMIPILVDLWGMTKAYLFIDTFVAVFTVVNGMLFFLLSRGLSFGNEGCMLVKSKEIPCKMGFILCASFLTCVLGVGAMILNSIIVNLDYIAFDMLGKSVDDLPYLICANLGCIFAGCLFTCICDRYGKRLWYCGINFAALGICLWLFGSFRGNALAIAFIGVGLLPGPFIVLTSAITLLVPEDRLDMLCWMTSVLFHLSGTCSLPLFGALEARNKGLGFKVMAVISLALAVMMFVLIPISKKYLHDVANGTIKIKDLSDFVRLDTYK